MKKATLKMHTVGQAAFKCTVDGFLRGAGRQLGIAANHQRGG
jgi:hypothetical protein